MSDTESKTISVEVRRTNLAMPADLADAVEECAKADLRTFKGEILAMLREVTDRRRAGRK